MADETGQPGQSGEDRRDPWASPGNGVPFDKGDKGESEQERRRRSVADQPTMTSGPSAAPPPVPPAPGAASGGGGPAPGAGYGSGYGLAHGRPGAQSPGTGQGYGYGQTGGQPAGAQFGGAQYGQQYGGQQYGQQYGQPGGGAAWGHPASAPSPYGYGPGPGGYGWPGAPLPNGKSVAAMVIGIISLVVVSSCWGSFIGIITSPVALGLGLSARRAADRGELGGRGQAVAGFVMGIVGTVLSAIIVTVIVLMFTVFQDDLEESDTEYGGGSSVDARGGVTLVAHATADSGA